MGMTYYDSNGETVFLFGKIPIYAVKKAFFKNKLGTVTQLAKMVYNSVTYDFSKTAEGGAVIFENDYSTWEFIAPDDRLDFEGYTSKTLGETFTAMKIALTDNPIPAWEQFAEWFNNIRSQVNYVSGRFDVSLGDPRGRVSIPVNAFEFPVMTSFVDFIEALESGCAPALGQNMEVFKTSDTSFACNLTFYNSNGTVFMYMTFKFRE